MSGLYGLVLAGGRSSRMRRDKAAIAWHGRPQLEIVHEMVAACTQRAYVSVRPDQAADPLRAALPQIVDGRQGQGPIAGIAAAQATHPEAAWLVLACDLPFLRLPVLEHLLAHRDRGALATAFRSAHDGLPEPLCAIWEPASRTAVLDAIAAGRHCPRKLLLEHGATLIEPLDAGALDNINTPEELAQAGRRLGREAAGAA